MTKAIIIVIHKKSAKQLAKIRCVPKYIYTTASWCIVGYNREYISDQGSIDSFYLDRFPKGFKYDLLKG